MTEQPARTRSSGRIAMAAVTVITLLVYAQVIDHDYIELDDSEYVYGNPHVNSGLTPANVKWAFTEFHSANWHPLTWISHMIDVQLFGLHPGAMKLHNVLLHLINTWLVFAIMAALGKGTSGPAAAPLRGEGDDDGRQWCAVFCAAVFALHPLHVESVAWVSERKDVLSTAFGFAALLVWIHHTRKPSAARYAAVLALFAASLMSKPMFVTLPCVMLLIDWWFPRTAKLRWVIIEKVPMFALVAASCVITYMAQHADGAVAKLAHDPVSHRVTNAIVVYGHYILNTVLPHGLTIYYPYTGPRPTPVVVLAAVVLAMISTFAWRSRNKRPWLLVGWLWYLGTLVPVIGFVKVGDQAMADRYMYIPMVGLLIMVAWTARDLIQKMGIRQDLVSLVAGAVLLALTGSTWLQIGYWRKTEAMYIHTLRHTRDNWMVHQNYGALLLRNDQSEAALEQFNAVLAILPRATDAMTARSSAYLNLGDLDAAERDARTALSWNPRSAQAYLLLGYAAEIRGQRDEALSLLTKAVEFGPDMPQVQLTYGKMLCVVGRHAEAIPHLRHAVNLNPFVMQSWFDLGQALLVTRQFREAAYCFEQVLKRQPDFEPAAEALKQARAGEGAE